jgi:actinin alpha
VRVCACVFHEQIQENLIFDNPLTNVTIEALRGSYNTLKNRVNSQINEFQNQILQRDAINITEEQMRDYEKSFKHFDKNSNGRLDRLEFRGVLLSLGFPIPQIPQEGKDDEFEAIWRRVDRDNEGTVCLEEFVAFMAEEAAGAESANDLLDAFKALSSGTAHRRALLLPPRARCPLPSALGCSDGRMGPAADA